MIARAQSWKPPMRCTSISRNRGLCAGKGARTGRREVEAVKRRGAAVLVLEPTATDLAQRPIDDRADVGLAEVCEAARISTLARLALPEAAAARRLLDSVAP